MTTESTKPVPKIELLPKGEFIITLEDGSKHRGRFSYQAINRFCVLKGINTLQLVYKLTTAMLPEEYAELTLMALQENYKHDYSQCPFKDAGDVMDKFFDAFGLGSDDMGNFFIHAVGRLATIKESKESEAKVAGMNEDEKKST